jgi:hypothetical protein
MALDAWKIVIYFGNCTETTGFISWENLLEGVQLLPAEFIS